jgi:hypothetical protein
LLQPPTILLEDFPAPPISKDLEHRRCQIPLFLLLQGIDDPLALPAIQDQTGSLEDAKLVGDARLGHLQSVHQLTNAELSFAQQT